MEFNNPLLRIVWEDDDLIVINKREGLLSVSTDRIKERTAYRILSDYLKECDPRNKIFVLHRLDRDTSGIMMFAKNQKVKEQLQSNWSEAITQRTYVAVIEGRPEKDTDLIVSNLVENKHMQVYVTQDGDGKEAITRYRLLQTNNSYSLLELELETGRKNQIRAQMQSIGHPVAGDTKYGRRGSTGDFRSCSHVTFFGAGINKTFLEKVIAFRQQLWYVLWLPKRRCRNV